MSSDASDGEKSEISLHRSESEESDQSETQDRTEDSPPPKKKRTDKSETEEDSGTSYDSDEDLTAHIRIKSVVERKEEPPAKKRRDDSENEEDRRSNDSSRRDRSDRRTDDYDRRADSDGEDSPRRRDRSDRRRYYDDRRRNYPDRRQDEFDRRDDGYRRRDERRREDFDLRRNDDRDRQRERSPRGDSEKQKENDDGANKEAAASATTKPDPQKLVQTKTGGAYIPPAKLRMMQQQMTDKSSEAFQQLSWEALKKSINGLINKVNVSNIKEIVMELFHENIVRGRGLLARSILTAQNASPTFTHVYAALVSIINTRFPQNGELILRRVVMQFRRSYRRNQKDICLHSVQFIAHLINQQVAHEILGLQILTLLLETPTDDSVEVAIGFLKESGQKLGEVSPRGLAAVFERLRVVLHEEQLEKRVQYMIEVMFAVRKDGFKEHPAVIGDLDLVDESDQFTHMLTVDDNNIKALETEMNVFKVDPDFLTSEENYKQIKKEILDESDGGSSGSGSSSGSESDDEEEEEETTMEITDKTETNLVALRRTIYLAVQSSLTFEECAHKILKMEFAEKDYGEICAMIIDCCSQLRTYEKFFGLLGGRFCMLKKEFMEHFELLFAQQYETIHRLETNKLRNVAKFFAHLLHSDAIPWSALANIRLSEETTTSSSRIFIKILFQEITEYIGITKLNERLKDPTLAPFFEGIFPRDNPKDTRFAINFFTSIGLGGITDELREHLKVSAVLLSQKLQAEQLAALNASTSDDSSSEDSSPDEERKKKKKKLKKRKTKKSKKQKKKNKKNKKAAKSSDSSSEDKSSSESESEKDIKKKSSKAKKKHKKKKEVEESESSSAEEKEEDQSVKERSEKRNFNQVEVDERRDHRRSRRVEDTERPSRPREEGGRGNDQERRQRSPDRGRHGDDQRWRRDFEQRRQSPDRRRKNDNNDNARTLNRDFRDSGDRQRSPDRRRDNGRQRSPNSPGRRRDNNRNRSPDRSNRRRDNNVQRSPDRSDRRLDNRRQRSPNSPDRRRDNDVKRSPDRSRPNDRSEKSTRRRSPSPPSRSYKEDRSRRDTRMDGKKKYIKPRSASVSSGSPSSGSESDSSPPPQSRRRPARSVSPDPRSRR